MTFHEAAAILGKKNEKKIGNNTHLVRRGPDAIAVRLHKTDVVTLHASGKYTLTSGGWRSSTTKARINKYAPVRVYQENFGWFIGAVPFFDGIEVSATGTILNAA